VGGGGWVWRGDADGRWEHVFYACSPLTTPPDFPPLSPSSPSLSLKHMHGTSESTDQRREHVAGGNSNQRLHVFYEGSTGGGECIRERKGDREAA